MNFIQGVIAEMKKVTWPTFSENNKYTLMVISTSIFFAILFGIADWIFSQGISFLSTH